MLHEKIKNLKVQDVQCDETWGFVQKKEGHKWPHEVNAQEIGDAYCWIGLERTSKLVLAWHLGKRTNTHAMHFAMKLRHATSPDQFQLTTDGYKVYRDVMDATVRDRADFAMLVKVYKAPREGQQRYSPAEVVSTEVVPVFGEPDPDRICTSHIERQNLSIRMGMRRMTRLTNGFSKKWANHHAAFALWFAFYNFCRRHQTLRITPAMAAGITDHMWSVRELLEVA